MLAYLWVLLFFHFYNGHLPNSYDERMMATTRRMCLTRPLTQEQLQSLSARQPLSADQLNRLRVHVRSSFTSQYEPWGLTREGQVVGPDFVLRLYCTDTGGVGVDFVQLQHASYLWLQRFLYQCHSKREGDHHELSEGLWTISYPSENALSCITIEVSK